MRGTVLIVPGLNAYPTSHWFAAVEGWLEERDFTAETLKMGYPGVPLASLWAKDIENALLMPDKIAPFFLVGHSAAGPAILRFVRDHSPGTIQGVMLVAPIATNFYRGKHKVPSFVLGLPPKIKLIKDKVERWGVACSEDDESVPQPENAEWYAENLDARLAEFKNERHFADDQPTERCPDGTRTLPPRALNLLSWVIDL